MHLPAAVRRRIFYVGVAMIFSSGLLYVAKSAPVNTGPQLLSDPNLPRSEERLVTDSVVTDSVVTDSVVTDSVAAALPAPASKLDDRAAPVAQPRQTVRAKVQPYVVVSGDTVESIAQRFGLEVPTILWSNHMDAGDILQIDQELQIPALDGVLHAVQEGDTLWDIRESYSADIDAIVKANPDMDPGVLQPGELLIVPGGKPSSRRMVASARGGSRPSITNKLDYWPTVGPLTDYFGMRTHPVYGSRSFHDGTDIGVGTGTPIRAASSGTVVMAEWYGGYGKVVRVDHGGGVITQYSHLSSIEVDYGQKVDAGATIAYSGNTGVSTGPHLHFSVLVGGSPVDPLPWLP